MDQECMNEGVIAFIHQQIEENKKEENYLNTNENKRTFSYQTQKQMIVQPFQQNIEEILEQYQFPTEIRSEQQDISELNFISNEILHEPESDLFQYFYGLFKEKKNKNNSQIPNKQIQFNEQLLKTNHIIKNSTSHINPLVEVIKQLLNNFGHQEKLSLITKETVDSIYEDPFNYELYFDYLNDSQKIELNNVIQKHLQVEGHYKRYIENNILIKDKETQKNLHLKSYSLQQQQINEQMNIYGFNNRNQNQIKQNNNLKSYEYENELLGRVTIQDHGICYNRDDVSKIKQIMFKEIKQVLNNSGVSQKKIEVILQYQIWEELIKLRNNTPLIDLHQHLQGKEKEQFTIAIQENKKLKIISEIAWIAEKYANFQEQGIKEIPHYKILVIGKTGAGKTTSINMLVNLIRMRNYEDERLVAIKQIMNIQNEEGNDSFFNLECNLEEFKDRQSDLLDSASLSQTQECNMYTISTPCQKITLVDTPGFGDTEGTDSEKINIQKIITRVKTFSDINMILYVHRSTDCRADLFLKYYINQMIGMLTKDFQKNFVVCFTSTINQLKIDAKQVLKEIGIPLINYIYFENDCLTPLQMLQGQVQKEDLIDYQIQAKQFWNKNKKQYEKLQGILQEIKPQSTKSLVDLFINKECIYQLIFEKKERIKKNQKEKEDLEEIQNKYSEVEKQLKQVDIDSPIVRLVFYLYKSVKANIPNKLILNEQFTICKKCQKNCKYCCNFENQLKKKNNQFNKPFDYANIILCQKCNHYSNYHDNAQINTEVVEKFEIQKVPCIYEVGVTNENESNLKIKMNLQKEELKNQMDELKQRIQKRESEINQDILKIMLLNKQVLQVSMKVDFDSFIDYYQEQVNQVKNNQKIDFQTKEDLINKYNDQMKNYQFFKEPDNQEQEKILQSLEYILQKEVLILQEFHQNKLMANLDNIIQGKKHQIDSNSNQLENFDFCFS